MFGFLGNLLGKWEYFLMLKRIFLKVHVTLKDPMYNLDIKLKKNVPNLDIVSVVCLQFYAPKGSKSFLLSATCTKGFYMY